MRVVSTSSRVFFSRSPVMLPEVMAGIITAEAANSSQASLENMLRNTL